MVGGHAILEELNKYEPGHYVNIGVTDKLNGSKNDFKYQVSRTKGDAPNVLTVHCDFTKWGEVESFLEDDLRVAKYNGFKFMGTNLENIKEDVIKQLPDMIRTHLDPPLHEEVMPAPRHDLAVKVKIEYELKF